jgi:hypothetical protein
MINKRGLPLSILWVGGALILGIGIQIGNALPTKQPDVTGVFVIGSLLLCGGLTALWNERFYEWFNARIRRIADWFGIADWQVLLLIISPLFIFLASAGAGFSKKMYSPTLAALSWIIGIALIFLGGDRFGDEKPKVSRSTILLMIILTFIAFLCRGIAIADIPIFLSGDEGAAGVSASQFVNGEWNNIFIAGWY